MFGEASRFVIAKRKAPAFHIIFKYTRQSLASNFDIAKDAMPNIPHQLRYGELRIFIITFLVVLFLPQTDSFLLGNTYKLNPD